MAPAGRIARSLDEVDAHPSSVTIGFFDGVHRGHQAIIGQAVDRARQRDLRAVAVTFDRHPREVVEPGTAPPLLMTLERRTRTIAQLGVDLVAVLPFNEELSRLPPEDFVSHVLVGSLDARQVVVGANFRFGHRAAGDVDLLEELGTQAGYELETVALVDMDSAGISSTEIRERLQTGDVEWVARALGRPHVVDGTVVRGEGRGHDLGVPTANIEAPERLQVPGFGVYAGHVQIPGGRVPAVTSVGVRPTFHGETPTVEPHLIDWEGDLYGAHVAVEFAHRLRDEEKFDSVEELVAAMKRDIDRGRELLLGSSS